MGTGKSDREALPDGLWIQSGPVTAGTGCKTTSSIDLARLQLTPDTPNAMAPCPSAPKWLGVWCLAFNVSGPRRWQPSTQGHLDWTSGGTGQRASRWYSHAISVLLQDHCELSSKINGQRNFRMDLTTELSIQVPDFVWTGLDIFNIESTSAPYCRPGLQPSAIRTLKPSMVPD